MVLVEAVCCSTFDVTTAFEAGAGRVELCSAIELGGLTPSTGFVRQVVGLGVRCVAMVRPRPSGFVYGASEVDTMVADAAALAEAGIGGFVFAALNSDRTIDVGACQAVLEVCPSGRDRVFHRAFDATPDFGRRLRHLVELGFTRILTSGGAATAFEGCSMLADLVSWSEGRIEILPAGGVRASNAREIIDRSGAQQLHLGPMAKISDDSAPFYGCEVSRLDGGAIREVVAACSK